MPPLPPLPPITEAASSLTRVAHRMFVELAADVAFILSDEGVVEHASDNAESLLGVAAHDLAGKSLLSFAHNSCLDDLGAAIKRASTGKHQTVAAHLVALNGTDVHLRARIFLDPATNNLWLVAFDLSSANQLERELRRRASQDALTGLPNRDVLHTRLEQHIDEARKNESLFATVGLDLDGFKKTNDAFGHLAGDALLKEVAKRIKACLRAEDTVSRTGGDEFVLLLPNLASPSDAEMICHRVLNAIRKPIQVLNQEVYISSSMGIAMYPEHGATVSELMQHADQAMYLSKHQGKNRLSFFQPELTAKSANQVSLETAMHKAINDGEFLVYYQPLVNEKGELKGCEALMRWRRQDGTFIPPADFIPVAENNGLITLLGDYVLRVAVTQLRKFEAAGLSDIHMSVNVSPRQLRHPGFEQSLQKALRMSGIDPSRLILEITESMLMNGQERTQALLRQIAATGVRLSIDDFGTGYSCLAYLKTYPISLLKVDRSFVTGIDSDAVSHSIVKAVISLAKALNLKTVAEGVETQSQANALQGMNIDYLQGYLFGKPVTPDELIAQFAPASDTNEVAKP